jgi:parallel beta-helix repeat protein
MRILKTNSPDSRIASFGSQSATLPRLYRRISHRLTFLALVVLFIAVFPAATRAQGCDGLVASGDTSGNTDWSNITSCLNNVNHATLLSGTFYISQKITMPAPFASLTGAGNTNTTITPVHDCSLGIIEANGQGNVPRHNITVKNFGINLINCSSTAIGNVVNFLRTKQDTDPTTTGGEISGLRIYNRTTDLVGILVSKTADVSVLNNVLSNVGTGIWVANSPNTRVDGNQTTSNHNGIFVQNHAGVGGIFDSSNTVVTNNNSLSATSRGMKFQSSDAGSRPLRNLTITGNTITGFTNVGLYLVGFVQDSRIENNYVVGAPSSTYGLWVGSVNPGQTNAGLNPSFNNQINLNTFQAKKADVSFNGGPTGNNIAGPDQPTITRRSRGNNTLGTRGIEQTPTINICSGYARAFWTYENGLNYVLSGGQISVAAAGIRTGSRVTFHVRQPGSSTDLLTFTTVGTANTPCALNPEQSPAINLAAGLYDVVVDLVDGNARFSFTDPLNPNTTPGVPINGWKLAMQLDVR